MIKWFKFNLLISNESQRVFAFKMKAYVCVMNWKSKWCLPAMSHAMMAGMEIENVDPSRTLSRKIDNEQNTTLGDESEWVYLGRNSMIKVKTSNTVYIKKERTDKKLSQHLFTDFTFNDGKKSMNFRHLSEVTKFSEAHRTACCMCVCVYLLIASTHLQSRHRIEWPNEWTISSQSYIEKCQQSSMKSKSSKVAMILVMGFAALSRTGRTLSLQLFACTHLQRRQCQSSCHCWCCHYHHLRCLYTHSAQQQ